MVVVTQEAAEQTALATRGTGYGSGDDYVVWEKVGCVFLGYYTGFHHPRQGYVPPTFPAYLVQVLAEPIPGFPMLNIGVIVINAATGEQDTQYGGGDPPDGMMGTTCGVSP
jgi:hypothetical protein